jgi:hypothetical protein
MNWMEKAQMHLLRSRWHDYGDELVRDERSGASWYLLDLADAVSGIPNTKYRPDGRRRALDG